MARLPFELPNEIKKAFIDRLQDVKFPVTLSISHILRSVIYLFLMVDNETLEEFLIDSQDYEEQYNKYQEYIRKYKELGLIENEFPETNGYYTELIELILSREFNKIDDTAFKREMKYFYKKVSPSLSNSDKAKKLFEKMQKNVSTTNTKMELSELGVDPDDNPFDKPNGKLEIYDDLDD